jgi:hypothetical protein
MDRAGYEENGEFGWTLTLSTSLSYFFAFFAAFFAAFTTFLTSLVFFDI